jgi:hypothetical protein
MKTTIALLLLIITMASCQFIKSVKKDLVSGVLTKGDGLSCEDVYLSLNTGKTNRNTFIYGEKFFINFNNIEGFNKENENVFPGMRMYVVSKTGDTVLQTSDLYGGYSEGIRLSPLLLIGDLTVASPMRSKDEYTLHVNIWDKKGKGTIGSTLDFKIVSNDQIRIEANKVTFNEIYLFSKERDAVITDNLIKFNENIYVIFEGVSGLMEINGLVFPGLSISATDNEGKIILDYKDLFSDYSQNGIADSDFKTRVSAHFTIFDKGFKNPLHCKLTIWDKKSDNSISASTELILE